MECKEGSMKREDVYCNVLLRLLAIVSAPHSPVTILRPLPTLILQQ